MNLRKRVWAACILLALGCSLLFLRRPFAQTDLQVTYGSQGIQTLSYRGVSLEDVGAFSSDSFHIWHMKSTDLNGNVLTNGQYGWGENNNGRSWNSATHTWTYQFNWGSITTQFVQNGNTLNMNVTEVNNAGSGIIFDGATIYPLVLHFPQLPASFVNASYNQFAFNTTAPSATLADYGSGEVLAAVPTAAKPLYSGFQATGSGNAYVAIISSTSMDSLASFQPHNDRPVAPGQTDSFTVSLRFAPSGTAISSLAADVYSAWSSTWPAQLNWTDRRIIGTAYLASSAQGNQNQPAGYPNNPRRYFNDSNAADFDVRTAAGLALFQKRMLQQAATIVTNLKQLNAQGVVTWDIEGEQYPMNTSYVCSPDQIATIAPEMESTVTDKTSAYYGMKLDDAYFRTIHDAGFRVGVCVRPQNFVLNADGTAQQVTITSSADVTNQLIRKMKYAHDRWGATLFYLDSSVDANGAALDASIYQQAAAALSDSLLIPEEATAKGYAYAAPLLSFLFHGDLGTDTSIYNYYPAAFSANLVNDVSSTTLAAHIADLTASVSRGDVLMVHADYWQANNNTVMQIYSAAGRTSTSTTSGSSSSSSTSSSSGSSSASGSSSSGSTSSGSTSSGSTSSGSGSTVSSGSGSTSTGTSSSSSSGSASTSSGSTASSSGSGSTATGTTSTGTGSTGTTTTAASNATSSLLAISYPSAGSSVSGVLQVSGTIQATLDAAGSYLMVDGVELGTKRVGSSPFLYSFDTSTVANGAHTLQLWAHDTGNNTLLSGTVPITVANGAAPTTTTTAPSSSTTITPSVTYPIALTYPVSGQAVAGVLDVMASMTATLDAAGSYLMVDGMELGTRRVGNAPYVYAVDTSTLANGTHQLQVWAHDIGNNTLLSNIVNVLVQH